MHLLRKPADYGNLKEEMAKQGLEDEVAVVQTGCHGLCALGPIMIVYPDATFYSMVKHGGYPGDRLRAPVKGPRGDPSSLPGDRNPRRRQGSERHGLLQEAAPHRPAQLRRHQSGIIEEYIGTGGYEALGKVLTEMTPDDVIQTLLTAACGAAAAAASPPA